MGISEFYEKSRELQRQQRELEKQFSEEHQLTKKFKGKIVKAYDVKDKEWSEPFQMDGVRLNCGQILARGHAVLPSGNISEGLMRECFVNGENNIEVIK